MVRGLKIQNFKNENNEILLLAKSKRYIFHAYSCLEKGCLTPF